MHYRIITPTLSLILFSILAMAGISHEFRPAAAPANQPENRFSSTRAYKHVQNIAAIPHPTGSIESDRVRTYIKKELKKLGLRTKSENSTITAAKINNLFFAARLENIVLHIPGKKSTGKILIMSHYDTVPTSMGAADNSANVASILELIRALKYNNNIQNDLIFLFSDAEEIGHLGASAFLKQHAEENDIQVVLNIEARGNSGPSLLFETGENSGKLIDIFSNTSHPVSTSLASEVYRLLPNETDFTEFRNEKYIGYNFGFIQNVTAYHTLLDSPENLDQRSLQHQGQQLLELTATLGNLDLKKLKDGDQAYFNIPGYGLIHYSLNISRIFVWITVVIFLLYLTLSFKNSLFRAEEFPVALLFPPAAVAASSIAIFLFGKVLRLLLPDTASFFMGGFYQDHLFLISYIFLSICITTYLFKIFSQRIGYNAAYTGTIFWWAFLMIAAHFAMPGAAYFFQWPLLFVLLFQFLVVGLKRLPLTPLAHQILYDTLFILCFFIPAFVLVNTLGLLQAGLTFRMSALFIIPVTLTLLLFLPLINGFFRFHFSILPASSIALSLIFFSMGLAGFKANQKEPLTNSAVYIADYSKNRAEWFSCNSNRGEWLSQFFSNNYSQGGMEDFLPLFKECMWTLDSFSKAPTKLFSIDPPRVSLVSTERKTGYIEKVIRVKKQRESNVVYIFMELSEDLVSINWNGGELRNETFPELKLIYKLIPTILDNQKWWTLIFMNPPSESIYLKLKYVPSQKKYPKTTVRVYDQSFGFSALPDSTVNKRPEYIIPAPTFPFIDSVFAGKEFQL